MFMNGERLLLMHVYRELKWEIWFEGIKVISLEPSLQVVLSSFRYPWFFEELGRHYAKRGESQ